LFAIHRHAETGFGSQASAEAVVHEEWRQAGKKEQEKDTMSEEEIWSQVGPFQVL